MFHWLNFRLRGGLASILILYLFTISCSAPMAASSDSRAQGDIRYIVQLVDPPLAAYGWGIPGLAPTNPAVTGQRLDLQSPASQDYLAYLSKKRTLFKEKAEQLLAKEIVFENQFSITINAVVVIMTPAEAARIATLPDVHSVEPDRQLELHSKSPGGGNEQGKKVESKK